MGRAKKPIALLKVDGKKHLTKAEIAQREAEEIKVDLLDIKPPDYLDKTQVKEFNEIAYKLLHIGIFTELDEDTLARYLISKREYNALHKLMKKAIKDGDVKEMQTISKLENTAFNQCRACAADLGLNISSRCRLSVPKVEEKPVNKFVEKFG